MMKELIHKRTLTSKVFQKDVNISNGRFHIGHIHYPTGIDKNGSLEEIDTTLSFNPSSGLWSMTKASYDAEIDQYGRITFHNVSGRITLDPLNTSVQSEMYVTNEFGKLDKSLIWRNVLGQDMHMYCEVANGRLRRIFRFERKPSFNTIDLKVDMSGANFPLRPSKNQNRIISSRLALDTITPGKKLHIDQPRAWNHLGLSISISFNFYDINGNLFVQKVIPQSFIDSTFDMGIDPFFGEPWLETDDAISYWVGAGDGRTGTDTYGTDQPYTWTDVRESSIPAPVNGPGATTNGGGFNYDWVSGQKWPGGAYPSGYDRYRIHRLYWPIDTSGLTNAAMITAGTLNLTCYRGYPQGSSCIVSSSQADPTTLVANDYFDGFVLNSPIEGAARKPSSQINGTIYDGNPKYTPFALNSNGVSWINKTGYTQLGMRYSSDIDDVEPTFQESLFTQGFALSEYAGTQYDPYLEVTYVPTGSIASVGMNSFIGINSITH